MAQAATVAQVRSLAGELPHAAVTGQKKKKVTWYNDCSYAINRVSSCVQLFHLSFLEANKPFLDALG